MGPPQSISRSARSSLKNRPIFDELMLDVSQIPRRSPAAGMRAHSASFAPPMTALSASGGAAAGGEPKAVSPGPLDQFAALAAALEHAAVAIARLDALAAGHPLLSAWHGAPGSRLSAVTPAATGARSTPGISPR